MTDKVYVVLDGEAHEGAKVIGVAADVSTAMKIAEASVQDSVYMDYKDWEETQENYIVSIPPDGGQPVIGQRKVWIRWAREDDDGDGYSVDYQQVVEWEVR